MTNKILIVPKGHFGDMLLTTPVFEALKRSSPDNHITVLAPPQTADLARRDPFVDEVIVFDRRKEYPGLKGVRAFVSLYALRDLIALMLFTDLHVLALCSDWRAYLSVSDMETRY